MWWNTNTKDECLNEYYIQELSFWGGVGHIVQNVWILNLAGGHNEKPHFSAKSVPDLNLWDIWIFCFLLFIFLKYSTEALYEDMNQILFQHTRSFLSSELIT